MNKQEIEKAIEYFRAGNKVSKKFFERRLKDEYSVYIYNYRNAGNGSCNNVCIMQGK